MRDYIADIEAALAAAAREVLDVGLATVERTACGAALRPRSRSACPFEVAEIYCLEHGGRPDALVLLLGEAGRGYPEAYFASPEDDTLFDDHWLEFLAGFMSRYVPPVLAGRVEEEEIRLADGRLVQTWASFTIAGRVERFIGVNEWSRLFRRKVRTRRTWTPYTDNSASS
jgi:hypothetical protein